MVLVNQYKGLKNKNACPKKRNPLEAKFAHWVVNQRKQFKVNIIQKKNNSSSGSRVLVVD